MISISMSRPSCAEGQIDTVLGSDSMSATLVALSSAKNSAISALPIWPGPLLGTIRVVGVASLAITVLNSPSLLTVLSSELQAPAQRPPEILIDSTTPGTFGLAEVSTAVATGAFVTVCFAHEEIESTQIISALNVLARTDRERSSR